MSGSAAPNHPTQRGAATAHAFVRRRRGASLSRCVARLLGAEGVSGADRVTGRWDVVLRLHGADPVELERLARAQLDAFDVEAYELHFGSAPAAEPAAAARRAGTFRRDAAHEPWRAAYAVVRLDRAAPLDRVHARLAADPAVVACDPTDDGREAVLRVEGATPAQLQRALARLRAAPGVAALRTLPVVGPADASAAPLEGRMRAAP